MLQKEFEQYKKYFIPLCSLEKLRNILPGEWESNYIGGGIEFDSIRPFEPGDDIKDIDLHTLVQSGEQEIIHRKDRRQMKIFICADFSGSMQRFERMLFPSKSKIREMVIGLLLFSAWKMNSPVGLCSYNGEKNKFFEAQRGQNNCEKILHWIMSNDMGNDYDSRHSSIDIQKILSLIVRRFSPQSMIFLVSDFEDYLFEGDFSTVLRIIADRFDLIPVIIRDPLTKTNCFNKSFRINVCNNEEDRIVQEFFLTPQILKKIQAISEKHILHLRNIFHRLRIEPIIIDTNMIDTCFKIFTDFFQIRQFSRRH